ncbi:DUF3892 domain-containing protein [Neobacillus sp. LXY-1]|uniref:DUF3892 domain-containing protein n=1 Tax=Neobacillus sp. LXY-1 TaxID=3379133 RepID=UPI003EE3DE18
METIVALHRNHFGEIINFVTSGGRVISYQKALIETENGELQGVQSIEGIDGAPTLMPLNDSSFEHYPNLF